MSRITAETIFLLITVVVGFVSNCLAVFLKQWIFTSNLQCMSSYASNFMDGVPQDTRRHGVGLVPFHFSCRPYFRACSVMMIIAFSLYIVLVGSFVFALVCSMLKKTKLARTGYSVVAILSFITAALQITSFIVTLVCENDWSGGPVVGVSCYLALGSAIFGFFTLALSWFMYIKKEGKSVEWSDGAQ